MKVELKVNPMNEFPSQVEGEHFSKTVLVYDKDLEDVDLGYYDFESQKWQVMGGFQMELICWTLIPVPNELRVLHFDSVLTD
ncbi:hypothetical protein [Chryseobacterium sp.]|uniref:hypothetical protein n=1 Tax=Chryseobacterium sp. TaxID=1871047 RepID=UPI00289B1B5D|nr:hypothetical protein [Chryseobacterium sp.]